MAGVPVYTAISGSDGTLGGLQRQGKPWPEKRAVVAGRRNDPLRIEGAAADRLSLAVRHVFAMGA